MLGGIAADRLVFLDESAALTNLVRTRARSPRGTRAQARSRAADGSA